MNEKVQLSPLLGDAVEHRFRLALDTGIQRHENGGLQFTGKRLDELLRLVIEVGDPELGPERAERLGAAPCNGIVVGDADDQPTFAFEQRSPSDWNSAHAVRL